MSEETNAAPYAAYRYEVVGRDDDGNPIFGNREVLEQE